MVPAMLGAPPSVGDGAAYCIATNNYLLLIKLITNEKI